MENFKDPETPLEFNMDSSLAEYTTNRQTFSRIRDVRAVDGMVLILADERITDPGAQTGTLETSLLSVRTAAKRASALNQMLNRLPAGSDRERGQEIVQATINACKEAQRQKEQDAGVCRRALSIGFTSAPKDVLERLFPTESKFTEVLAKQKGMSVESVRKEQLKKLTDDMVKGGSAIVPVAGLPTV